MAISLSLSGQEYMMDPTGRDMLAMNGITKA